MTVGMVKPVKRFQVRRRLTVHDRLNVINAYFGSLTEFTRRQCT